MTVPNVQSLAGGRDCPCAEPDEAAVAGPCVREKLRCFCHPSVGGIRTGTDRLALSSGALCSQLLHKTTPELLAYYSRIF